MQRCNTILWALLLLASYTATALEIGDQAPDFRLEGSDGNIHQLSDYRGQNVVVAWFPQAFTRGCTVECRSLARNTNLITQFDTALFMASVDSIDQNTRFAEDNAAEFPLLSDEDRSVARSWGVLHEAGHARRETFYIGPGGRILWIDRTVNAETAAEDMAERLQALGVPLRD